MDGNDGSKLIFLQKRKRCEIFKADIKSILKRATTPLMRRRLKSLLGMGSLCETVIVFKAMRNNAKNKVMVDVGAHHGDSLEEFARDGWTIYAFEPDPENRLALVRLCRRFPNVTIDPRAISDRNEKNRQFYTSDVSSGISGLSAFDSSHKEAFLIDTVTLDNACREKGISNIDFLKIDTEGFDLFVLKGVPWNRVQPQVIVCEFEDGKTRALGYCYHDMANFLEEKGYQLIISEWYPITDYGSKHQWRRFSYSHCNLLDENSWGNIIAVKNDKWYRSIRHLSYEYKKRFV